jgi:hypothetical protein
MIVRRLSAGPLTMLFDEPQAFLRYVRFGDREIIRGVFAAVRDRDWNSIPFSIDDLHVDQADGQFTVSWLARCLTDCIPFEWQGDITGSSEGRIQFRFAGRALGTFLGNRIGLCVLHPIEECAGQKCLVEHVDGTVTEGIFPKSISPHQPFKNIATITHHVWPSVETRVSFQGDTFEMEDQRNWTDASFKTYSTPLELPFPIEIRAGTRIEQTVTIELRRLDSAKVVETKPNPPDTVPRRTAQSDDVRDTQATCVQADWQQAHRLPFIGFGIPACAGQTSPEIVERMRELAPDHLRVDINLHRDKWPDQARKALELAERIGTKLEVALFVNEVSSTAWQQCLDLLDTARDRLARWLVFHSTKKVTPHELARSALELLRQFAPTVPCAVGTNAYFAELNRQRPSVANDALVCYSINPQVHAFDNLSLCETLGAQRWTVDSVQEYFGRRAVISPITLRPRFNPNATSASVADNRVREPEADPRQASGFAAAWTVGAIAALAGHPGVASLTFYETSGQRGIVDHDGLPFPMFSVFAAVRGYDSIAHVVSSTPLDVTALAVTGRRGCRLIVGNLSSQDQWVVIKGSHWHQEPLHVAAESVRMVESEDLP